MKLLLVSGSGEAEHAIAENIGPLGFDLIRYGHVLKAMDNIDEIDPVGIIISAVDFPRHWKVMVQFVRNEWDKTRCPIILLRGKNFSGEDAAKAFQIGVSGIVLEEMSQPREIDRLQSILSRYIDVEDKRRSRRFHAEPQSRFAFCLCNPADKAIVTGTVKTVSATGISFSPDDPARIDTIAENDELPECSFRIGDDIIAPICRMIRKGTETSLEFIFLSDVEQIMLEDYLERLPLEEVKAGKQD
jgi:hypothetical protein